MAAKKTIRKKKNNNQKKGTARLEPLYSIGNRVRVCFTHDGKPTWFRGTIKKIEKNTEGIKYLVFLYRIDMKCASGSWGELQ